MNADGRKIKGISSVEIHSTWKQLNVFNGNYSCNLL